VHEATPENMLLYWRKHKKIAMQNSNAFNLSLCYLGPLRGETNLGSQ